MKLSDVEYRAMQTWWRKWGHAHFELPLFKHMGLNVKDKDGNSIYAEDLNYGVGKATEPGSIFKLATLMSLLDDKYVTINSTVDCEGGVKEFYGLRIHDTHPNHVLTVKDAFAASSNPTNGRPTTADRPNTNALAPAIVTLAWANSRITPSVCRVPGPFAPRRGVRR